MLAFQVDGKCYVKIAFYVFKTATKSQHFMKQHIYDVSMKSHKRASDLWCDKFPWNAEHTQRVQQLLPYEEISYW